MGNFNKDGTSTPQAVDQKEECTLLIGEEPGSQRRLLRVGARRSLPGNLSLVQSLYPSWAWGVVDREKGKTMLGSMFSRRSAPCAPIIGVEAPWSGVPLHR
jgi:hypothetical protein